LRFTLEYSVKGENQWITFATGNTSVTDGVLGRFDPTMLVNGYYDVRLTALDASGNVSTAIKVFQADGQAKVGAFTLTFSDLTIPAAGVPITVTRSYDSRQKTVGDFGVGWTYSLTNVKVTTSSIIGDRIFQTANKLGAKGIEYLLSASESKTVSVTLPNGTIQKFDVFYVRQQYPSYAPPEAQTTLYYQAEAGTTSTLEALTDNTVVISPAQTGAVRLLDRTTGQVYNPDRWKLTTADGTVFIINRQTGIESITDLNGNSTTFSRDAITQSDGRVMKITRDDQGRISAITDPMGESITYQYDSYGDLVAVTDRDGNVTRYTYDSDHNLLEVYDALGRRGAREEYDDEGRLTRIVDAEGHATSIDNEMQDHAERVTDAYGNVSTVVYDDRGNVIEQIDALGHVLKRTFDDSDHLLEETIVLDDGTELTTSSTYDAAGHLLTRTDPAGETTTYTHDARGEVLTTADAMGNSVVNTYDSRGNRSSLTDPEGNTTTYDQNGFGLLLASHDAMGNTLSLSYDLNGNNTRSVEPSGRTLTSTYDANGNETSSGYVWVNPDNPSDTRNVRIQTFYDASGRVTKSVSATGMTIETQYDAAGNVVQQTDGLDNVTVSRYDLRNKLVETLNPDGTIVRYAYDLAGRLTYETDPYDPSAGLPSGTFTLYDAAGRVVGTQRLAEMRIDVNTLKPGLYESTFVSAGAILTQTSIVLDAANRVIAQTGPDGQVTRYEYDKAGRKTAVIDPNGQRTTYSYDADGHLTVQRDALGRESRMEYDKNGRLTKITYPDGTSTSDTYDALGRRTSETDQAGRTTNYEYDAAGHVTAVILPAVPDPAHGDALTRPRYDYTYDVYGNLLVIRDPEGRETHYTYDPYNRQTSRTLSGGETEQYVYDNVGRLVRTIDFKGQVQQSGFDSLGRPVDLSLFTNVAQADAGAPQLDLTTTYDVQDRPVTVTDPRNGVLTYGYTTDGLLSSIASPQGTISYEYNPATRRLTRAFTDYTDIHYTYDALQRLATVSVSKLNGVVLATPEVTTYHYTATGALASIDRPNGVTTAYAYDTLDRLVLISDTDSSGTLLDSDAYTLSPTGLRISVVETRREANGTYSQDRVDWTYDALDRLVREVSNDLTGQHPDETFDDRYTYDLAGNRLQEVLTTAGVTRTLTNTYDADDRLLKTTSSTGSVTEYTYDANGSLLETRVNGQLAARNTYDLQNHLVRAETFSTNTSGEAVVTTSTYVYDPAVIRVRSETTTVVGGVMTSDVVRLYLNDPASPTGYTEVLEERNAAGVPQLTFVSGFQVLSQASANGQERYLLTDAGGSTRLLTDSTGAITDHFDFQAFGAPIGFDPAAAATPLLFAGQWYDAGAGTYYLRARSYDPATGRFTQLDPFAGNQDLPLSFHKYAYAHLDPVNQTDPTGFGISAALVGIAVHEYIGANFEAAMLSRGITGFKNQTLQKTVTEFAEGYDETPFPILLPSLPLLAGEAGIAAGALLLENLDLRPDLIIYPPIAMAYEIKPDNTRQARLGAVQLAGYLGILNLASRIFDPTVVWTQGITFNYQAPTTIPIGLANINTVITVSQSDVPPLTGLILYDAREFIKLDLAISYATLLSSLLFLAYAPYAPYLLAYLQEVGLAVQGALTSIQTSIATATTAAIAAASSAPAWLPQAVQYAR